MRARGVVFATVALALLLGGESPAQRQPNLQLRATVSPSPAVRARPVTLELRAVNRGATPLTNVRLVLELTGDERVVSTSVPCSRGRDLSCRVGTIAAGAEAVVSITLRLRLLYVETWLAAARSDQGEVMTTAAVLVCTIVGTPASERLQGTAGADMICGVGGADRIDAGGGADRVFGTGWLRGGAGNDTLAVQAGAEQSDPMIAGQTPAPNGTVLDGGRGDDALVGKGGQDVLRGGAGRDGLYGYGGRDRLLGGAGADTVNGGEGDDSLDGGAGGDMLAGHHGDDSVAGGPGDDVVRGGYFNDSNERFGPGGDDRLLGGAGRDRVVGGKGRDSVDGGSGSDELFGGPGDDLLLAADGVSDLVDGRGGFDRARVDPFDRVSGVERVSGR